MEYRQLGKTGLKISRLGFGGIPIQKINAEETKKLLHYLTEQGVNYIDTARGYTVSEEYIGYALQGIRDRFVLATKSFSRTKDAMEKDIAKLADILGHSSIETTRIYIMSTGREHRRKLERMNLFCYAFA